MLRPEENSAYKYKQSSLYAWVRLLKILEDKNFMSNKIFPFQIKTGGKGYSKSLHPSQKNGTKGQDIYRVHRVKYMYS